MKTTRFIFATLLVLAAGSACAGTAVVLGRPLGFVLGSSVSLGGFTALPMVGSGVLLVAGVSLAIGLRIARRKRQP